jgi:hypothetical protein
MYGFQHKTHPGIHPFYNRQPRERFDSFKTIAALFGGVSLYLAAFQVMKTDVFPLPGCQILTQPFPKFIVLQPFTMSLPSTNRSASEAN